MLREVLQWNAVPSHTLSSSHRQGLVAEVLCREVAHPLGVGYQGVDTAWKVFRQQQGIGKYAVFVAANHQPLHQGVGLLVVQLYIDKTRTLDRHVGCCVHQVRSEPHRVACGIVGLVGLQIDALL